MMIRPRPCRLGSDAWPLRWSSWPRLPLGLARQISYLAMVMALSPESLVMASLGLVGSGWPSGYIFRCCCITGTPSASLVRICSLAPLVALSAFMSWYALGLVGHDPSFGQVVDLSARVTGYDTPGARWPRLVIRLPFSGGYWIFRVTNALTAASCLLYCTFELGFGSPTSLADCCGTQCSMTVFCSALSIVALADFWITLASK